MAICAICNAPCRSKCAKCGASLCAAHKPASTRSKCPLCQRRMAASTPRAHIHAAPVVRQMALHANLPTPTAPLACLTLTEQLAWIADRRARLHQKQDRERAYLDRRAARGAHTPTDDDYEADALLENDLFEALDVLESCLHGQVAFSGSVSSSSTYAGDTSFLFPDPGPNAKLKP